MGEINRRSGAVSTLAFAPRFVAIGDSLVFGDQVGGNANAWPTYFGRLKGWTLDANAGINGSPVALGPGAPMVSRWQDVVPVGYAGHVILAGLTNDYNNGLPLGYPGSTSPSTIYGALLLIGRGVLGRGPCMLHLCTPTWRGDAGRTEGTRMGSGPSYTLEQARQAMRDVAAILAREFPGRVQLLDAGRDLLNYMTDSTFMGPDLLHWLLAGHLQYAYWMAANILGADGVPYGIVPPPIPPSLYTVNFSNLNAGALAGQSGWTGYGATATVSASGLNLTAKFDGAASGNPSTSPAVLHDLPAGAKRVLVQVNPLAQSSTGFMLRAFHDKATNRAICAWILNGGQLDCGVIAGGGIEGGTSWLAGVSLVVNGAANLEVQRADGQIEVRHWALGQPRPTTATYTHADVALSANAFGASTIGTLAQPAILGMTVTN